jgi:regulator of protease activity HflC (stomatin/prohibitin superfamily)
VSGRFRVDPGRLPRLHADVGPSYVAKLVDPELLASVRAVFGRYRAEVVYASSEDGLLAALHQDFAARLARFGLVQADVQLERVALPVAVQDAIQKKLASAEAVRREQLEKDRRIIEAEGLAAFQSISGVPVLHWGALEATSDLAKSPNAKIIVIGNDHKSLPVLLNAEFGDARTPATPAIPPPQGQASPTAK